MLRIAGQTAGPIGLKFLITLMGGRGVLQAIKNFKFFSTGKWQDRLGLHFLWTLMNGRGVLYA